MDVCIVCVYSVCAVLCADSSIATGWSPVQGVLPTLYRIKKLKKWPKSRGLEGKRKTNSTELSPRSEATSSWIPQQFSNILYNVNVHYRMHKGPFLVPLLSQMNPFHNNPPSFSKINFNIILQPTSSCS
jgi:hypothetical protein